MNIEGEKRSAQVFLDIYDSIEDNEKYVSNNYVSFEVININPIF